MEAAAMIAVDGDPASGIIRIVLAPNGSLTAGQARSLVLLIGLAMGGIAIFFASMGAWLVLPFSGGEWALLALALWVARRDASRREVITIQENVVQLDVRGRSAAATRKFERAWLRVEMVESTVTGHPSRLYLRRHTQLVEIGRFLREAERTELASRLRGLLWNPD